MQEDLQNAITRLLFSIMQMQVRDRVHKSAYVRSTGRGIEIHVNTGRLSRFSDDVDDEIAKRIGDLKLEALGEAVHMAVEMLTNMMDGNPRCLDKKYFSILINQDAKTTLALNNKLISVDKVSENDINETKKIFHENATKLNSDVMFVNIETPIAH